MFVNDTLCFNWSIWRVRGVEDKFCIRYQDKLFYEREADEWRVLDLSQVGPEYVSQLPIYRFRNYNCAGFKDFKAKYFKKVKELASIT